MTLFACQVADARFVAFRCKHPVSFVTFGRSAGERDDRFDNRAVPIALAAVLIDTIGFGIVMPVFPTLITELGHIDLEQATRVAG